MSGYLHRHYAESFATIGTVIPLPASAGWLIERSIPGSHLRDGMGCYPLFACRHWQRLDDDLRPLGERLVSLTLVTDPFGEYDEALLRCTFDVVRPLKQHYVTDVTRWDPRRLPRRHRRNLETAMRGVRLEHCARPLEMLDTWIRLYDNLIARHGISGLRTFSQTGFGKQFEVPGLTMFKALVDEEVVGLHLWFIQGDVAYGHLGATSALGYERMASYALYWFALEQLAGRVRWLDLGAAPGLASDGRGAGLTQFKAGWSTGMRQVYLCGRIFQPAAYASLVTGREIRDTSYFPAYRLGEFGSGEDTGAQDT